MAITLSTGVALSIAVSYGSPVTMSAISNAAEAVATIAGGHSIAVGDYIEVTSGWDLLDGRVVRVKTVATNDITLEGVDTSNTTRFPSGSGTGSVREVTSWSSVTQLKSISGGGGTQNYADVSTLSNLTQRQVPTTRAAVTMDVEVFDDISQAWCAHVQSATDSATPYAVKMAFPNGAKMVGNAYWSLASVPGIAANEALTLGLSLSFSALPIRYAT